MVNDATLLILIKAQDTSSAELAKAEGSLSGLGKAAAAAGAAAAATAIGVGAASLDMAEKFQTATTAIVTGAGESASNIDLIRQGLLNMAGQVGDTPEHLAKGIYMIESAGFHGADALNLMKISAEGAKVGMADQAVVADALTSAINAYHLPASAAVSVTNDLIATVAQGKMHLDDLAGSLGKVLPIASNLGISLPQVSAAIATMTMQGTDANVATTGLRFVMASLAGPTSAAAKEMAGLGIGADEMAGNSKAASDELAKLGLHTSDVAATLSGPGGLPAAINEISSALQKQFPQWQADASQKAEYVAGLKAAVGGTRGMTAALELSGPSAAVYADNIAKIGAAAGHTTGDVQGWALVQQELSQKWSQFTGQLDAAAISLGDMLVGPASGIIDWGSKELPAALATAQHWWGEHEAAIASFAGTAVHDVEQVGGVVVNLISGALGPAGAALGFLGNNMWIVDEALGLFIEKQIAMKALDMAIWVQNLVQGFTAYAEGAGKTSAVMATVGLSGDGLKSKLLQLQGQTQATADVFAGRYTFNTEKAADANNVLGSSAQKAALQVRELAAASSGTGGSGVSGIKAMANDAQALEANMGSAANTIESEAKPAIGMVQSEAAAAATATEGAGAAMGGFGAMLGPIGLAAGIALPLIVSHWGDITSGIGDAEAAAGKFFGGSGQNWTKINDNLATSVNDFKHFTAVVSGAGDVTSQLNAQLAQMQRDSAGATGGAKDSWNLLESGVKAVLNETQGMDATTKAVFADIHQADAGVGDEFAKTWAANGHNAQEALQVIKANHSGMADNINKEEQNITRVAADQYHAQVAAAQKAEADKLTAVNTAAGTVEDTINSLKTAYGAQGDAAVAAYLKAHKPAADAAADIDNIAKLTGMSKDQVVQLGGQSALVYHNITGSITDITTEIGKEHDMWTTINSDQDAAAVKAALIKAGIDPAVASAEDLANAFNSVATNAQTAAANASLISKQQRTMAEGGKVYAPEHVLIGEGGEPEWVIPQHKAGAFAPLLDSLLSGTAGGSGGGGSPMVPAAVGVPVAVGSGGTQELTINLVVDGRTLAKTVVKHQGQMNRQAGVPLGSNQ